MGNAGQEHRTIIGLAAAVGALLLLPSCGALAEAAIEQAAEEATGFEVDEDDGSFSIEGEDISISFDDDGEGGSLSLETPEGSVQVDANDEDGSIEITGEGFDDEGQELNFTSDAEIPDGFPVPFPDGGEVVVGTNFENGDGAAMFVELRYDGSKLDELISFYDDYFDGDEALTKQDSQVGTERTVVYVTQNEDQVTGASIFADQEEIVLHLTAGTEG